MLFTESICDNKLYLKLYKKGNFVACPFLTAYFLKNNLSQNRGGITTGKKVGNAVKRNRARRIIRAAYRLNKEGASGCKTVFDIAPKYLHPKTNEELRKELL